MITLLPPGQCLCAWLSPSACVFLSALNQLWLSVCAAACMAHFELKARSSDESKSLKQVCAHLVVIGRRKRGSLCFGNWQQHSNPAQYNPAQPSTVQNYPIWRGQKKRKKRIQQQGRSLLSSLPLPSYPDSRPILIIPQQSLWQHFFLSFFKIGTVQSSPVPSISI